MRSIVESDMSAPEMKTAALLQYVESKRLTQHNRTPHSRLTMRIVSLTLVSWV